MQHLDPPSKINSMVPLNLTGWDRMRLCDKKVPPVKLKLSKAENLWSGKMLDGKTSASTSAIRKVKGGSMKITR